MIKQPDTQGGKGCKFDSESCVDWNWLVGVWLPPWKDTSDSLIISPCTHHCDSLTTVSVCKEASARRVHCTRLKLHISRARLRFRVHSYRVQNNFEQKKNHLRLNFTSELLEFYGIRKLVVLFLTLLTVASVSDATNCNKCKKLQFSGWPLEAVLKCHRRNKYIFVCGQFPLLLSSLNYFNG